MSFLARRSPGRVSFVGALVALQLGAIAVLGVGAVFDFRIWAEVDERAHYDYVQTVAEEGRLPIAGEETISPETQAIQEGVWPGPPRVDPAEAGFAGESYEAFQPPLYYLLAAPVFLVVPDHLDKVYALRGLNLLILFGAIAVTALLARELAGRRWLAPFAAALVVFLWPGFVVRAVTVSNAGLEILLVPAFLYVLALAHSRSSPRHLIGAGALLGLAALTKLTVIYLAPIFAIGIVLCLRRRDDRRMRAAAVAAAILPALVLAPWVLSNLDRYGSLTPNQVAREQQTPHYEALIGFAGAAEEVAGRNVLERNRDLVGGITPQEWDVWWAEGARDAIQVAGAWLFFAALVVALVIAAAKRWWRALLWLGVPFLMAVVMINATHQLADWSLFLPRYLYPTLPGVALLAGLVALRSRGPALPAAASAVASVALLAVWFDGTVVH